MRHVAKGMMRIEECAVPCSAVRFYLKYLICLLLYYLI